MKKVLSIMLSLAILVSSMAISSVAFASSSAKVEYSVCAEGMFLLEPTTLTVTADLSDKYGYEDTAKSPSILDATIAAHIAMFGEDFADYGVFYVSDGWTTAAFGVETSALSYRLNGGMDDGKGNYYNYNTPVKSGDYVEFLFYQDDFSYSDAYSSFDTRSKTVNAGEDITLTLSAEGYDANWNTVMQKASGVTVTVDGEEYGTTDENGSIKLKLNKKGDYIVSASGDFGYSPLFIPYCKVTVNNHLSDYVEKTNASAMKFLMAEVKSLDINSANDYLTYLDSGYDMSSYKADFLKSVKSNLEKNNGKLLNMAGEEDLGLYGAVIQILDRYDINAERTYGYDVKAAFESLSADKISNPYLYRVAIMSASEKFAKKLCNQLIKDYYTMGKGMNYWGYSCDNTAVFLTAIAPYADNYKDVVADAKKVIASYTTSKGCYYSADYTNENADSTAVAMMAYSALGDNGNAMTLFKALKTFESDTLGVMLAYGAKNEYATKEAVLALEYFDNSINNAGYNAHITEQVVSKKATTSADGMLADKCIICGDAISKKPISMIKSVSLSKTTYSYNGKEIKPSVKLFNANGKKISSKYYTVKYSNNKAIGTATVTITLNGRYSGTIKRTFTIKPAKPSGFKVKGGKGKLVGTWKKHSANVNSYQMRYSKKANMSNAKIGKTKNLKKGIKGLKKGKYYVQLRAVKVVDGKKYYSSWTDTRTVNVK